MTQGLFVRMASLISVLGAIAATGCSGDGTNPVGTNPGARGPAVPAYKGSAVMKASGETKAVPNDADDAAIWVNSREPEKSLILGTDKHEATGGLYVFDLEGNIKQKITPLDRPNNVDVEYGFSLGGKTVDLAVVTERVAQRLRIYSIDSATGTLSDVSGNTKVFANREGDGALPMGVGLYRRASDGEVFAIVSPKTGPKQGYLEQYRLVGKGGKVDLEAVRTFGEFSGVDAEGNGEIEAVCVDDELGFVYVADELAGIRKYLADPGLNDNRQLAIFGAQGYKGDREGLAIYATGKGTGYLLSSDQVVGGSRVLVYPREGAAGKPHEHAVMATIATPADETDGLDVTNRALPPRFGRGLLVMMNSKGKNFLFFTWDMVLAQIEQAKPVAPAGR